MSPQLRDKSAVSTNFPATDIIEALESRLLAKKGELSDLATMGALITSIHDVNAILPVVIEPKDFCRRVKMIVCNFIVGSPEDTLDDFTIMQVMFEK